MKRTLLYLFIVCLFPSLLVAQSFDTALKSSISGILAQKIRLGIIAENVANVSTTKVEETGKPYQKKFAILEAYKGGVRVKSIEKSQEPSQKLSLAHDPLARHDESS